MSFYCTYFDGGFLSRGLALWYSLKHYEPAAVLYVLALDQTAADCLVALNDPHLRVVPLADLEAADPELLAAKSNRSRVEYYFTLSPGWPLFLLNQKPEIDRLTYLDADLFFFASPTPIFAAMDDAHASILITEHRFPPWLGHYLKHGRFNVGILSFRHDSAGRACLADWRQRCLEWCHDRLENGRYADQKYLDDWPARFGSAVCLLAARGVNLAPWNWAGYSFTLRPGSVVIDGDPLILFHFARFRAIAGSRLWQSGQLDYGVMPFTLRNAIYSPYWRALVAAEKEIKRLGFERPSARRPLRWNRSFLGELLLRGVFGSDWLRLGSTFVSGRLGLNRHSGRLLARLRTIFLRR
jgi:hypothetical protein